MLVSCLAASKGQKSKPVHLAVNESLFPCTTPVSARVRLLESILLLRKLTATVM